MATTSNTTTTTNGTKLISIEIPVTFEYRTLWAKSKGYSDTVMTLGTDGTQTSGPNPETMEAFFEKMLKQELINIAIQPINSMIYQQINKDATDQINAINEATNANLKIKIV